MAINLQSASIINLRMPTYDPSNPKASFDALARLIEQLINAQQFGNQNVIMGSQIKDKTIEWRSIQFSQGSGSPSSLITPKAIGEEYLDTGTNKWYKAYGYTNTDWQAL